MGWVEGGCGRPLVALTADDGRFQSSAVQFTIEISTIWADDRHQPRGNWGGGGPTLCDIEILSI